MINSELIDYFQDVIQTKRGPIAVMQAITREYLLSTISTTDTNRSKLSLLSNDELSKLWQKQTSIPLYDPQPNLYTIIPCYNFLLGSISLSNEIRIEATNTYTKSSDKHNQVIYQDDALDYKQALYFIGIADEVLRPYIVEFCWSQQKTFLIIQI